MKGKILVLGSSNVDLILRIPRFHGPGETITGKNLATTFGGKGANQAVAAKRLGARVDFLTKLGRDSFGRSYREHLVEKGFDPRWLLEDPKAPNGVALIEVGPKGENRIIVSPGANDALCPADLPGGGGLWEGVKVLVAQLEIPLATVRKGLTLARKQGITTLLNPSPVRPLPRPLLSLVDYLVPNEWEAQALAGMAMRSKKDLPRIARKLRDGGAKNIVITLGPEGAYFQGGEGEFFLKAFRVKARDTTAAGDAFMGALACALAEGRPIPEALRRASGAGALAATRLGAQPSLPGRGELEKFLAGKKA